MRMTPQRRSMRCTTAFLPSRRLESLAGNEQAAQQAGELVLLADRQLANQLLLDLAFRARRSPPRLVALPRQGDVDEAAVAGVVTSGDITLPLERVRRFVTPAGESPSAAASSFGVAR